MLQIAPSGYWRHAAHQRNPLLRCSRAQRDDTLVPHIERVWQTNMRVYGADKDEEGDDQHGQSTHAASTQENSDEFTISQPVRDAIARADLAVAHRLRTDAERRAATYRAQAQACTTASSGIADRLEAFDRHIVEGASMVAEHRQALIRRDAEVVLLRGQIDADRALMAP